VPGAEPRPRSAPTERRAKFSADQRRAFHRLWTKLHVAAAAYDRGVIDRGQYRDIVEQVHVALPCSKCSAAFAAEKSELLAAEPGAAAQATYRIHDAASTRADPSHVSPGRRVVEATANRELGALVFTGLRRTG
jgi:hypothetical protein